MKTCSIMQPTYLPWLGYFDLISSSDIFVFLDHVQFSKQSWQQRNQIRNKQGTQLLVIPVKKQKHKEYLIQDVKIDAAKIPLIKHLKTIRTNYAKAKNFDDIFPQLEKIYQQDFSHLADLNIALIKYGAKKLGIEREWVRSSSMDVKGSRVGALVSICNQLGADHYLSPQGAKAYISDNDIFQRNGIRLSYQEYVHPVYKQINYDDFISHLGFIDYLFNK